MAGCTVLRRAPSSKAPSWVGSDHIWEMGAGVVRLIGGGALSALALHRSQCLSCQRESRQRVELEHEIARPVSFTAAYAVTQWKRKWQRVSVFLPGKSHGQWSLAGCSPWGCKRVGHDLMTKQQQHSDSDRLTCSRCSFNVCGERLGKKEGRGGRETVGSGWDV